MAYIIGENTVPFEGNIYNAIQGDKLVYMKNGDKLALDKIRLLLGEIQRDPNKDISNDNIVRILKNIRKQTFKNKEYDHLLVEIIDGYIPPPVSDKELVEWFKSTYTVKNIKSMGKRAFSIIGIAKKYFKDRDMNVNALKEIITEYQNTLDYDSVIDNTDNIILDIK